MNFFPNSQEMCSVQFAVFSMKCQCSVYSVQLPVLSVDFNVLSAEGSVCSVQ